VSVPGFLTLSISLAIKSNIQVPQGVGPMAVDLTSKHG